MCFMFLALLYSLACCDENSKYRNLVKQAKMNAKSPQFKDVNDDSYEPGSYSFENDHIHFRLLKRLTGPTTKDVSGYARDEDLLAIAHKKNSLFSISRDTVFVEPSNQKLYVLSDSIYQEDNVDVYECKEINFFSVTLKLNMILNLQF